MVDQVVLACFLFFEIRDKMVVKSAWPTFSGKKNQNKNIFFSFFTLHLYPSLPGTRFYIIPIRSDSQNSKTT